MREETQHEVAAERPIVPILKCETAYLGSDSARVSMLAVASAAAGVVFGFLLAALALAPTRCQHLPRVVMGAPSQQAQVTYLGVEVRTAQIGDASASASSGAFVVSVLAGSPAEAAGIEAGDYLTSIDGYRIATATDLIREVRARNAGDWVMVRALRKDGSSVVVPAVLGTISRQRLAAR